MDSTTHKEGESMMETDGGLTDQTHDRMKDDMIIESIGSEKGFEEFEQLLKDHDHTFDHSDDRHKWKEGILVEKQIQERINLLSEKNFYRVEALVKKYSVMGGSIFRFNNKTIGDDTNGKETNK